MEGNIKRTSYMMTSYTVYVAVLYFVVPVAIALLISIIKGYIAGQTYLKKSFLTIEKFLRMVFPYIKKSGNHNVIFGFIISKESIIALYFYTSYVILLILLDISVNMITFTYQYNPYDGLECFGVDGNNSRIRVNTESEAVNVTRLVCMGWNTDIGGAVGHAGGVLTLSWILASIVLWVKLNLSYMAIRKLKNKRKLKCAAITCVIIVPHIVMVILTIATILGLGFYGCFNKDGIISFYRYVDIMLILTILNFGITICWNIKKQSRIAAKK